MGMILIPYLPSFGWYAAWVEGQSGQSAGDNIRSANRKLLLSGKDFTRTEIRSGNGPLMLSLPIEGGSGRLKKPWMKSSLMISDHGNWRRVHLGAIEANYGKTPFFQHLFPILSDIYASGEKKLETFTSVLHEAVVSFLFPDREVIGLEMTLAVRERGEEVAAEIDPSLSILDAVMRYGKETVLALMVSSQKN